MNINPWIAVFGGVLTLIGTYVTARFAFKAQATKVRSDEQGTSGALALSIANETREEFRTYKAEQSKRWIAVRNAWNLHDDWDQAVLDELDKFDPGARRRMPRRPTLPLD